MTATTCGDESNSLLAVVGRWSCSYRLPAAVRRSNRGSGRRAMADPIMQPGRDPMAAAELDHVYSQGKPHLAGLAWAAGDVGAIQGAVAGVKNVSLQRRNISVSNLLSSLFQWP